MVWIMRAQAAGAFFNPNGSLLNWYWPSWVRKEVFSAVLGWNKSCQKHCFTSSNEKYIPSATDSTISSTRGKGNGSC